MNSDEIRKSSSRMSQSNTDISTFKEDSSFFSSKSRTSSESQKEDSIHTSENIDSDESNQKEALLVQIVKFGLFLFAFAFILYAGARYYGSSKAVTASAKKLPIYCVKTDEKKVALSFDAAWGNEDTANILSILSKHNVKVTFFMTGEWVRKYPDDVKAIAAAGHDLGNHSENHKQMSRLSAEQCRTELQKAHDRVKELTGTDMTLFRPPYGDYNNNLISVTNDMGYHCIQWDVDSLDWKDYGTESIIKTVTKHKHLSNGSIILMHNGAKYTPAALEAIITGLKDQGYELVPISELIYKENYEMDHEGRQFPKESPQNSGDAGNLTSESNGKDGSQAPRNSEKDGNQALGNNGKDGNQALGNNGKETGAENEKASERLKTPTPSGLPTQKPEKEGNEKVKFY